MKIMIPVLALGALAGCTQTSQIPENARWSGPYHVGSASGRGYPLWPDKRLSAVANEALAAGGCQAAAVGTEPRVRAVACGENGAARED
jgi:hypothetical protein